MNKIFYKNYKKFKNYKNIVNFSNDEFENINPDPFF